MTDHADLRMKAEAATKGTWSFRKLLRSIEIFWLPTGKKIASVPLNQFTDNTANEANAAYIAAANPSAVLSLIDRLEAAEKRASDNVYRGKLLVKLRDRLINAKDKLADEGDRVYFGSTNDADLFRDVVQELDAFKWDRIIADGKDTDYVEACQRANARAEAAEAERDRLKAALEFYANRRRYEGPNMPALAGDTFAPKPSPYVHDVTKDRGEIARTALNGIAAAPPPPKGGG